ncbi:MAG TPA: glycosyltransferase [Calditrichaeota bacterium]|nr:glycosyltransferase [Calditrichota bacterium]
MSRVKNKKRIILVTIDPIERNRRVLNQLQTVTRLGWVAEVITVRAHAGESAELPEEVRIVRLPLLATSGPLKFMGFNALLKIVLFFRSFDLVFVRGVWPAFAVLSVHMVKKFDIVYDAHEYFAGLPVLQNRKFVRNLWLWLEKQILKRSKLAFTVSEPILERLYQRYPFFNNWLLIRNLPPYRSPANQNRIERNGLLVVYHGYFMPERGLENLLQALAKTGDVSIRLKLVGDGILKEKLHKLVIRLSLEERVEFIGMQTENRLNSILSTCDLGIVLLLPVSENHKFALPNKFFDYIMTGVPVLASNIPSLQNYIEKYKIGLTVNPDNIDEIARKLDTLALNKEKLARWQQNCFLAAKELCWDKEEIKLRQAYEKILS